MLINSRRACTGLHSPVRADHRDLSMLNAFVFVIVSSWTCSLNTVQRLSDAAPSLHLHYRSSSLLRTAPSLCCASVLSCSQFSDLHFSLIITTTGSRSSQKSLILRHAHFTPDTVCAAFGFTRRLIPKAGRPFGFDVSLCLRRVNMGSGSLVSWVSYLLVFTHALLHRSLPWLFTTAAWVVWNLLPTADPGGPSTISL